MLGRMDPEGYKQKGFDLLLDALPMVNEVAIKTNSKLTVIGSGALASTFKKQISPYNWVQYFEQIPHQQVKLKLKQSDVVLMPSRYEGLSVFALEGLQEGLAFVMSDAGALRDLWSNNGWLVSPLNAQTLSDAMIAAMNDTSLQSKQQQSIQLAQQAFTQTIQWQQFLTIWEAITDG
jgi:glycosyltransferase involved in cell wall biosynthesis